MAERHNKSGPPPKDSKPAAAGGGGRGRSGAGVEGSARRQGRGGGSGNRARRPVPPVAVSQHARRGCADCAQPRPRQCFSTTQWNKGDGSSRCSSCIVSTLVAPATQESHPAVAPRSSAKPPPAPARKALAPKAKVPAKVVAAGIPKVAVVPVAVVATAAKKAMGGTAQGARGAAAAPAPAPAPAAAAADAARATAAARGEHGTVSSTMCSSCGSFLCRSKFSQSQLGKAARKRRCLLCVDGGRTAADFTLPAGAPFAADRGRGEMVGQRVRFRSGGHANAVGTCTHISVALQSSFAVYECKPKFSEGKE